MKTNLLKSIFISLILVLGVSNAWAATIFNCGIEVNETWYRGTGTINSGNWLDNQTAFNNKDFGVITSLKLGGQYDTWDNNQTDNCSWNASNGITITIKKGSTQKDQFKLSCYHSGKDGNNNVWKTTGTIGQCDDENAYGRYTHNISQYAAGNDYTIAAKWFSPSSISTTGTAKFTIPGFTTTSTSQTFDNTTVNSNSSKTISFGTHYGTTLKTNNCSISGTNHTEFSVTSINESGVTVQFKPTSAGSKTATLTITDAHSKKCTITLSGTATLPTYTVTFNANGHGTAPVAQTVSQGSKATQPAAPTATGYTFGGWYKESNCTNAFDFNTAINANITLYAKWTANTYAVTLNPQSGTGGTTSVTATYGSAMPAITKPTRTGYTFNGYYDATSGGTQYYEADGSSARTWNKTSNTTLYAQWTINRYTITYGVFGGANGTIQLDGGNKEKNFASTTVEYNTSHILVAEPDNNETHKREGWYSDVDCTKKIADGSSNTYSFTLTNDMTVYVKFVEAAEVMSQVVVDANKGGTVSPSGTVEVGNRTPTTFTATPDPGYRFDSWTHGGNVKVDAESNTHEQGSISITATRSGTLTANFVRVYTVNFFATPAAAGTATATVNGNAITSGDKLDANTTTITFTAAVANAYNEQCTFLRWVDGAGTILSTAPTYTHTVTNDITVKAIFKITQYTLTFSADDGGHVSATANNSAIASPATLDYNTSVTLTAEPDAGCAFRGWFDGNKQYSSSAVYKTTLTADKNLEARFTTGTTVYMKSIEYWKKDHPRYAIYYWGAGDKNGWEDMTNVDCNGDIYEGYVPAGYTNFKFVRLAPSTSNEWENKWNETPDLTTTNNAGKMYIQPHVYLKPSNNWKSDGARFAARFWNDGGGETWMSMNDLDGDGVYSCEIPTGYAKVIFVRMNGSSTENNWDNKWNQTIDLNVPTNNNILYTLTNSSWDTGSWGTGTGLHKNGWQTYAEPSYKITYSTPTNGTITVTKAGNPIESGTSLTMGDEIKITFIPDDGYELINYNVEYATETGEEGVYSVCGPTNITTVEFAKAGTARTVYLRPNEDWLRDEPIFAAYAWNSKNNTQNHWYIMTTKADDYTGAYSCNISSTYDWVTFVRIKPAGRDGSDGSLKFANAWNQTKDLAIIDKDNDKTNDNKLRFAIGDKVGGEGEDKEKYDGKWEENTPIWGITANFNDWKAEKAVFKGYPGHLDEMPSFGTSHAFKLYNFVYENNKYLGNAGTMKRANSGQWWTMDATEQANCQMMLDVKGDYIYQMRFLTVGAELRKQISVTYPKADTKYALLYKDKNVSRISYDIPAVTGEQNDIISFFVDKDANPTIKLLVNTTETGNAINVSVPERGVYNFVLQQNEGEVKVIAAKPEPYKGNYYIRTDAASGGWGGYKQDGNKMTYTSYADKNHNFDHYYCKWVESSQSSYANVKFCVANDYSHALSDELNGDEIIEKTGVATGCLPDSANVRFAWDSKTNELSRAYISGSAYAKDRFLVLTGNKYLLDIDSTALNVSGLKANEALFADKQNWIYQLDVQANNNTEITLTAQYNGKVQTFFGTAKSNGGSNPIMQATNDKYHKVRMIYDFKTNNLVAAWLLDETQYPETTLVASNMLIIRENQDVANQINFSKIDNDDMKIQTAYAVMTFTKKWVTGAATRDRSEYWVSFPFDVNLSDVFGFSEYGDQWIMQLYDGEARAKEGYWAESKGFWKYITNRNYTLKAGVGYVLKLNPNKMDFPHGSTDVSLFFPSQGNPTIINAEPTSVVVPEHICTINRDTPKGDRRILDSNWNLIGVPGFANLADLNVEYPDASKNVTINNDAHNLSFYYAYDATTNSYNAEMAQETFKNMHAYMVQFAGTIDWKNDPLFNVPAGLAARRNSDAEPEKLTLRLEIAQGEEKADQTFVQMQQEGATADFDMNVDMTKIINSGANIYTLVGSQCIQTAGNALPFEETTVAVGVDIATAGEYTFRMPDGTEGMVVELIDYELETTTNLLLFDYTVTLPKGTNEDRFALHIQPSKSGVTTGIDQINGGSMHHEGVQKYLIDGQLYIVREGVVYDAQGHRL